MRKRWVRGIIKRGEEFSWGNASILFLEAGVVEACDPYGCLRFRADSSVGEVYLEPIPALYRPERVADCIFIEFEEPYVYNGDGGERGFWLTAPIELAIHVGSSRVAVVTPLRAKYTLIGDVVDGVLCRYHRSPIATTAAELVGSDGVALVELVFKGSPRSVPGIGFPGLDARIYSDNRGTLYYSRIEVSLAPQRVEGRVGGKPALPGDALVEVGGGRGLRLGGTLSLSL